MKIYINGQIVDEADAKISVFDRGYLFGEGLFETLRSYDGKLPFLDKHLKRMEWSSSFVGIPFPHPGEIERGLKEVLKVNGMKNARIKIILSGKNGETFRPLLPTDDMEMTLVIGCEPFQPPAERDYEVGVVLTVIHSIKSDAPPTSTVKSLSWISKLIARREFQEKGCYDGVLLDAHGFVTEATTANIFWVKDKKVYTAPTNMGLLPGVTRDVVIELVRKKGWSFEEKLITPDDLKGKDEIFLTGSTLEVMPVTHIDSEVIGSGRRGPLTAEIQRIYRERIGEEVLEAMRVMGNSIF